jgi:hypothetical protein
MALAGSSRVARLAGIVVARTTAAINVDVARLKLHRSTGDVS